MKIYFIVFVCNPPYNSLSSNFLRLSIGDSAQSVRDRCFYLIHTVNLVWKEWMDEGVHMDAIHPYAVPTFIGSYSDQFIRHLASCEAHPLTSKAGASMILSLSRGVINCLLTMST